MEKELAFPMSEPRDFIDELFSNYLCTSREKPTIFSETGELTRSQLEELVVRCEDVVQAVGLTSRGFIVLHGENSPTQLAWVFAAILTRIPFCFESDENCSLSSTLLSYGDVLKVDTDSFTYTVSRARDEAKEFPSQSQLAYIVSTSGSTGKPKIIPISRSNMQAFLEAIKGFWAFSSEETWLWEHRLSFDAALLEIFGAITFGANLNIAPYSVADWGDREICFLKDHPSQIIMLTPSELKSLARLGENATQEVLTDVKSLIFCGERLGWDSLRCLPERVSPSRVRLYNVYGPSETTIIVSIYQLSEQDCRLASVPLGEPIGEASFRIDEQTGELFISGPSVFAGYLGVEKEWDQEYATGDIVEREEDGCLIFKGRISGYLNVNGKRVDPHPTIEVLCSLPEVLDAYIWARNVPPFDQIIAAVKVDEKNPISKRSLRSAIKESDSKAVPTKFCLVSAGEWPITKRGKLDSQALIQKIEKDIDHERN